MNEVTSNLIRNATPKVWVLHGGKTVHVYDGPPPSRGDGFETWGGTDGAIHRWIVVSVRWSFSVGDGEEWPGVTVQVIPLAEAKERAKRAGVELPDFGDWSA
jgi:hypothetical protein